MKPSLYARVSTPEPQTLALQDARDVRLHSEVAGPPGYGRSMPWSSGGWTVGPILSGPGGRAPRVAGAGRERSLAA